MDADQGILLGSLKGAGLYGNGKEAWDVGKESVGPTEKGGLVGKE